MNRHGFDSLLVRAERIADRLLDELGIRDFADLELLHQIEGVAAMVGFDVEYGGVSGVVARVVRGRRGRPVIRVRAEDRGHPRARFSVAHEIGHDRVHEGQGGSAWCSSADLASWKPNARREAEANAFASAFLVPRRLVSDACDVATVSLEPAKWIGERFDVSLTAAALRFVRLCPEPCALIGTSDGVVDMAVPNRAFWPRLIAHGADLHPDSLAHDFFSGRRAPRRDPEAVPAAAWLEDERAGEDLEVVEHSLHLNKLGRSMSLIWLRDWPDEEEAEEAADVEEDAPRFR